MPSPEQATGPRQHARQRHGGRRAWLAVLIVLLLVVAWLAYWVTSVRLVDPPMAADDSCRTDPSTVADLGDLRPGGPVIRCEPWDIGTGVQGYRWEAPDPRGVLLLQHGFGGYAQRYVRHANRLIPHLLDAGLSVHAFDMWGHGRSPGRRGVVDVGLAIEDHLAARRKLAAQPLPVFVYGHSLGGLVTATSAARDQRHLDGVIVSSAFLLSDVREDRLRRTLLDILAVAAPTLPTPVKNPPLPTRTRIAEEVEAMENDPMLHLGSPPVLAAATGLRALDDSERRYPGWRLPILVLHGTADASSDPEGSRALYEAIASKDKELHLVAGGAHNLLDDLDRDATLGVILEWLTARLPPARPHPADGGGQSSPAR
jgi:acylglycerol lipase